MVSFVVPAIPAVSRAGYSSAAAAHVAALLDPDPDARPKSLTEWTAQLKVLGRGETTSERYLAFAMTVDGTATPLVGAATATGVFGARLGTGLTWQLSRDPGAPAGTADLAMVTDGAGERVIFAATGDGHVRIGRAGKWTDLGPAVAGSGLAATRDPYGVATGYAIAHDDHELIILTVSPDGSPRRIETSRPAQRVLSATVDGDGTPIVLILTAAGELVSVDAKGAARISRDGAFCAAACTDRRGELRCYRVGAGQDALEWYERAGDGWDLIETVKMPGPTTAIACAGHREGVGVAIAGPAGSTRRRTATLTSVRGRKSRPSRPATSPWWWAPAGGCSWQPSSRARWHWPRRTSPATGSGEPGSSSDA